MKHILKTGLALLIAISSISAQNAEQIVSNMINTLGGKDAFYNLKNVTYNYYYSDPNTPMKFQSKETYVFDGELSLGEFSEHSILEANGKVTEGFNGKSAWVKFNGKISNDTEANNFARFLRKTNYYWFTMFFKLQDEGVNLEHIGTQKVEGRDYDLIKVTFGDKVGDAQDTYVLYINKRTHLVDQFLFTILAFGIDQPKLMRIKYDSYNGIKIPYDRAYTDANWDGEVTGKEWVSTFWSNIKFKQKIDKNIFKG